MKPMDGPYFSHPALSFSQLNQCGLYTEDERRWTPHLFGKQFERSSAMDVGTIVHAHYYEPDAVPCYAIRPLNVDRVFPRNSKEYALFTLENEGKILLHPNEAIQVEGATEALKSSKILREYEKLEMISTEQGYLATCSVTGMELRIKPDRLRRNADGVLICEDLKTVSGSAEPVEFRRECYKFNYFRRFAFYRYVLELITGEKCQIAAIVVEKDEPNNVALYQIDEVDLDKAEVENMDSMIALKRCIDTGDFQPAWRKRMVLL